MPRFDLVFRNISSLRAKLARGWKGGNHIEINQGYEILKSVTFDNGRGFALSVETLSSQQIELLSGYLDDWENISFEDKRKAADGLISSISATSDYVKIEWKI